MIVLIVSLVCWRLTAACTYYLQRHAPTNLAVRALRSSRGLKWAIPVACVLTPSYLLTAFACTTAIKHGGPGWLHLLVLLCTWNGLKFAILSALSPLLYVERAVCHKQQLL